MNHSLYFYSDWMKGLLLILISCCFLPASARQLLVNGGFEDENICTEYNVNCAPEAWISNSSGFNNYFKDRNRAHSGEHCMAVEAGHSRKPYQRTFIRSQLVCALRKGSRYRLRFYVKSPHAVLDSVGVYFGSMDPLLERKPIHRLAPSLFAGTNNRFEADSSWQPVTLSYLAQGDETYITLAYFGINDVTGSTGLDKENHFFIFFDDISLSAENQQEALCDDWLAVRDEIYAENARHEFLQRMIKIKRDRSTGPLVLSPTRVFTVDTLTMPDILFVRGKASLEAASFALLDSFCRQMKGKQVDSLVIDGHADSTGTAVINDSLSLGRAIATAAYLRGCAYFGRVPFVPRGWSARKPLFPNTNEENRRRNRRVELRVYYRE